MVLSGIYFLDQKGKVIISRIYRSEAPSNTYIQEKFIKLLLEQEEIQPIFQQDDWTFNYIRHQNLYIIGVGKGNYNVMLVFAYLQKLLQVLQEYFNELEEESLRDNFVITYELLDEMMDNGYPQITEWKMLKEFITSEASRLQIDKVTIPKELTTAVSWRPDGIKYRKNEIFLDVIEKLNLLVASNGAVLRSEILGIVKMNSFLSGMPELKLGLNDKVLFEMSGRQSRSKTIEIEDIKFHQCVRLARFENDRTISFIPPDGQFELMSYRLDTTVKPLI